MTQQQTKAISFIKAHGETATATTDGRLRVVSQWTRRDSAGHVVSGETTETIEASSIAVHNWLGY